MAEAVFSVTLRAEVSPFMKPQLAAFAGIFTAQDNVERLIELLALEALLDLERAGIQARKDLGIYEPKSVVSMGLRLTE